MTIANPAFLSFLVGLLIILIVYTLTVRKNTIDANFDNLEQSKGFMKYVSALGQDVAQVLPSGAIKMNQTTRDNIADKLRRAGNPWGISPAEFRIVQIGAAVLGVLFGGLSYFLIQKYVSFIPWPVYTLIFGWFGYIIPGRELKKKADNRLLSFRRSMPDALDLIIIENGIHANVMQAIITITPRLENSVVKEEFTILCKDVQSGRNAQEALKAMAERAPSPDMEAFVNVIIQSIVMSVSANSALEDRAKTAREEYIALINEKIASLSSRMMIYLGPTMILALVIVSIAPSLQAIMSSLSN